MAPSRRTSALTPEWKALRKLLKDRFVQARLSSLIHFASERSISPGAFDQSMFEEDRLGLLSSLRKNPDKTYDAACREWNKAVDTDPDWPRFKVSRPIRQVTWTLPWSDFPASLLEEILEWLRRLSGDDLLEELPFRPLRRTTLILREYQFREAASALVRQGWDPQSIRGLADLTTLEAFKVILRYLIDRRGGIPRGHVGQVAMLLKSTARHKFDAPKELLDAMEPSSGASTNASQA